MVEEGNSERLSGLLQLRENLEDMRILGSFSLGHKHTQTLKGLWKLSRAVQCEDELFYEAAGEKGSCNQAS